MTTDFQESSNRLFLGRHKWKFVVVLVSVLCYQIPLLGYLWRVTESLATLGLSQASLSAIENHTDWFKRYFTGPPSDAEMIAFFRAHRADMDRLAYILATEGYCFNLVEKNPSHECGVIEQRLGLSGWPWGSNFANSALRNPKSRTCGGPCQGQSYSFTLQEPQQWRGTTHSYITGWQKTFIYVPPLVSAERFGLSPEQFPSDPVKAVAKHSYIKQSLDSISAELDANPDGYKESAVLHIDDGWFLGLNAIVERP